MSGLAQYLSKYNNVQGSDIKYSEEIKKLENLGVKIFIGHDKNNLQNIDLCVYNSAISESNEELIFAKKNKILLLERNQLLAQICNDFKNVIAISGTHGKTTTTAMLSKIFIDSNYSPTVHLGGFYKYINGNFLIGEKNFFITEACEYKKNFLTLFPNFTIINNVELDHTDCYNNSQELYETFFQLIQQTKNKIFVFDDDKFIKRIKNYSNIITYGFKKNLNYCAYNIRKNNDYYIFDVLNDKKYLTTIKLNITGKYNIINALACISVCHYLNIPLSKIKSSLESFENVDRRFEFLEKINNSYIYRDYAHHPTEIENLLSSCKELKFKNTIVYFQPHTYSRTIGLFNEFLHCFQDCDKLYLLPTYKARETEIIGGRSEDLFNELAKIKKNVYFINDFESCKSSIINNSYEKNLILLVGAGDIGELFNKKN